MNKKAVFLSLLFSLILQQANCQFEFGLKSGYAYSWPGYGDIELPENAETHVNGFNVSFFVGTSLKNGIGLSVHPGFTKRGAACFPGWQPVFVGDSKVFLEYFEIPFLIHKKFNFKIISIVPGLGYGFSLLNSATLHTEQEFADGIRTLISTVPIGNVSERSFNRFDHGFYLNLRIEKKLMKYHFVFFDSSFFYGLKDYDKINTSKNRTLNLNLGFGYSI